MTTLLLTLIKWETLSGHLGAATQRHVFADGGYVGDRLKGRLKKIGQWTMEIVKRSDHAKTFTVLPRRCVVERTFASLGRCRRLAKDWERPIASAEAWITTAHIRMLTRRLARY